MTENNKAAQRAALAYVCEQWDFLRAELPIDRIGEPPLLQRLLAAIREGSDLTGPLDALHEAVLASGDALGIYGSTRGVQPVGIEATATTEAVYLCPAGRCSRYTWPQSTDDQPRCQVTGKPLRRDSL